MGARFMHDCRSCRYLGSKGGSDLYVCGKTLIARRSSDGPDYASMPREIVEDWRRDGHKPANPDLLDALDLLLQSETKSDG